MRPDLIFVLAGQSNMAGRGDLAQAETASSEFLMLTGEDGQVRIRARGRGLLPLPDERTLRIRTGRLAGRSGAAACRC